MSDVKPEEFPVAEVVAFLHATAPHLATALTQERLAWIRELGTANERIAALEAALNTTASASADKDEKIEALCKRIAALEAKHAEIHADHDRLQRVLAKERKRIAALEERIADRDAAILSHSKQAAKRITALEAVFGRLAAEVQGVVSEPSLVDAIGPTNYNVLRAKLKEAKGVLDDE